MLHRFTPKFLLDWYHRAIAIVAAIVHGHPSRKLVIIGVTGTNGKTTVSHFIATILEAAGKRVGLISTIALHVGGEERVNETKMTTLKNSWQIQKLLRAMVDGGDEYAVIETTSHALDQYRVHHIAYDVAVVTNVTHEHLDYHKTLDAYRQAKERLFRIVAHRRRKRLHGITIPRITVMNADDPSHSSFLRHRSERRMAYGFGNRPQEVAAEDFIHPDAVAVQSDGSIFVVNEKTVQLHIPGRFTVANALAAIAATQALGVPLAIAAQALQSLRGIPGRLDCIREGQPFTVMIDYAVTPDSFEKLAELVRTNLCPKDKKWWWVFGATGERDRAKRPILGDIAARGADYVVLTNEDPFHEDPERILDEVEAGVFAAGKEKEKTYWRILDRREAIRFALHHAMPGDVVTITGKGAETAMAIGDERIPWNEAEIVRAILRDIVADKKSQ